MRASIDRHFRKRQSKPLTPEEERIIADRADAVIAEVKRIVLKEIIEEANAISGGEIAEGGEATTEQIVALAEKQDITEH